MCFTSIGGWVLATLRYIYFFKQGGSAIYTSICVYRKGIFTGGLVIRLLLRSIENEITVINSAMRSSTLSNRHLSIHGRLTFTVLAALSLLLYLFTLNYVFDRRSSARRG